MKRFAQKYDFPFPLLSDPDHSIALAYGACDSAGDEYPRRAAAVIDPEGKISEFHPSVDARKFPDEQLERLRQA